LWVRFWKTWIKGEFAGNSRERDPGRRGEIILSEKKKDNKGKEEQKSKGENLVEVNGREAGEERPGAENEKSQEAAEKRKEPTSLERLQDQLAEKTREATETFDKWLRLRAEFENYKKRMQKEKADLMRFGNESLLKSILPILDNLERAIDHGKGLKENTSLLEGVELTLKQFLGTLERFGVKPVPAKGEVFDPEKHEAISYQESDQEPHRVISEILKGYLFHERLLRPAKVIVSREKAPLRTEGN
jgi:molecular chaperone GrpE